MGAMAKPARSTRETEARTEALQFGDGTACVQLRFAHLRTLISEGCLASQCRLAALRTQQSQWEVAPEPPLEDEGQRNPLAPATGTGR